MQSYPISLSWANIRRNFTAKDQPSALQQAEFAKARDPEKTKPDFLARAGNQLLKYTADLEQIDKWEAPRQATKSAAVWEPV
jgi:hypothetical protein